MAAAVYNNVTTVTDIKLKLNDTSTTDADAFLTNKQYDQFILNRIYADETTWTLTEVLTGRFKYLPSGLYLYNDKSVTTSSIFTGENDVTYEVNPNATIQVSAGTHAGGDIVVTAARIDLNELMVDLCFFIANHRAKEVSMVMSDGSFSPEEVYRKMITMAEYWRGVRGAG